MNIKTDLLGKRFNSDWIYKNFSFEFAANQKYALVGNNGSGKSTLLRTICGIQSPSKGTITWNLENKKVAEEQVHLYTSFVAPAMEIIEEMTVIEFLTFHFKFKPLAFAESIDALLNKTKLTKHRNKKIEDFSSGMKQRVKLLQAFYTNTPLLCLDEPCSNLDEEGIQFYQECLKSCTQDRITIIASNDLQEFPGISNLINLNDLKK